MNGVPLLHGRQSPSKTEGSNTMHKFFLTFILLSVPASTGALAHSGTDQEQQACTRDAYRFCRELADHTSDLVIAGGSETVQNPFGYLCFAKSGALSPQRSAACLTARPRHCRDRSTRPRPWSFPEAPSSPP